MRRNRIKVLTVILSILSISLVGTSTYAHSGRTDSRGGHKDNKNKSGLGSYHYHCGGHPAHLHTNGVCPYSSNNESSNSKPNNSNNTTKPIESKKIKATEIQINETITDIEVGETKQLTTTIKPSGVTDKKVSWKSSNDKIIAITSNGKIQAMAPGKASVTVITSNGKTATIGINVIEKEEENLVENVNISNSGSTNNIINNLNDKQEDSGFIGGIVALGMIGGCGYIGYRKIKR